jgi:hypothetical protein
MKATQTTMSKINDDDLPQLQLLKRLVALAQEAGQM